MLASEADAHLAGVSRVGNQLHCCCIGRGVLMAGMAEQRTCRDTLPAGCSDRNQSNELSK
jgi:hypothetical protein